MAARRGLAAVVLILAACAGPGPAPGPAAAPPGAVTLTLPGAERPLPAEHWPARPAPRAVVLGLHGYGDRAATTFARAGPVWAEAGFDVWAYDQRGFGRNPDHRRWPGDEALIADAAAVARHLAMTHPGLPLFVIGHSMGGGVALAAAGEGRLPPLAGLVALAPAVWGGGTLPLRYRLAAWLAATLAPERRWTGEGVVTIRPSDNDAMLAELARDPWHFATPASRDFLGLIRLMDRALAAAPAVRAPVLIVWGVHDQVVPEAPMRALAARIPGAEYARMPRGWHMLLRDLHAAEVHRLVQDWMIRHVPDPA